MVDEEEDCEFRSLFICVCCLFVCHHVVGCGDESRVSRTNRSYRTVWTVDTNGNGPKAPFNSNQVITDINL